jgi:hypothetical protein
MMSPGALDELEPGTCRITANQLYQDCVSFRFTLSSGFTRRDFLRTGCGNPRPTATLLLGFWARLLKNEKRPVMLIRRDYVRVLCDKLETIPCRIILD